jgi:YD repeat-containing protein
MRSVSRVPGKPLTRTTRTGYTTSYSHDSFGNLVAETDPLGNVTSYTYDDNGNC